MVYDKGFTTGSAITVYSADARDNTAYQCFPRFCRPLSIAVLQYGDLVHDNTVARNFNQIYFRKELESFSKGN